MLGSTYSTTCDGSNPTRQPGFRARCVWSRGETPGWGRGLPSNWRLRGLTWLSPAGKTGSTPAETMKVKACIFRLDIDRSQESLLALSLIMESFVRQLVSSQKRCPECQAPSPVQVGAFTHRRVNFVVDPKAIGRIVETALSAQDEDNVQPNGASR